ncbi:VWA domain-containing protein [Morganella morganii]|uniref:VWA domain-containing protein n=1 Tax=Morganellaceae TaxID=1903414 RepID=UPI0005B3A6C7|nr:MULTISPECIES: VWA domain-containing protein [Morganellaceae]MDS0908750.1 VWA domain-containing protein [Morganella morganii]
MGIYNSLPVVARALSDQLGVNVTVGGSTACASQQGSSFTINIPFYKDAEKLSDVLLGYLVHEAAHVKYTEFPILKEDIPARAKQGYNPSVLGKLVNITEDLRIERAIGRRFPGVPSFLKALNHFVFNEDTKPTDDPAVAFINGLLLCGFKRYHALNIPVDQAQSDFIRLFGQNMFDTAMDILGLAINAPSIADCLDISCRLYDLAVDAFNDNQQDQHDLPPETGDDSQSEPSSDNSQPGEDNDSADSNVDAGDGSSDGQSSQGTSAQPGNEPENGDSPASGSDVSTSVSTSSTPSKSDHSDPFANVTDDNLNEVIKDAGERLNDCIKDNVSPSERTPAATPFGIAPAKRHATREASVLRGVQAASGLRQSMHGLLQGMQQTRRTHKETGRVMDTRRLTSALLGETKLFRHKSKAVEFNSAFTVLLDSSSSLGSDMVEAEAAVVSLLFALDGIKGVSTSAYHFPHATANNVGLLKAREQSFRAAVNAKQFGISANGCTPLEQALWPAFSDLLNARADRHVMVVVTDGKPDNSGPVIQMVNDAKKEGVIVIGIGFGGANSNIMTSLFDDTGVAVGSVSALRGKLLEVSRKALTR